MKGTKQGLTQARTRYTDFLKRNKMLRTQERTVLLEFLFRQKGHFSADDLIYEMRRAGLKVSRATLYRALSHFVEAGILSESDFGHGHTHYEIDLGSKPHVHLVSLNSDEVKEVADLRLQKILEQLARRENFTVKRYKIQVFGAFARQRKRGGKHTLMNKETPTESRRGFFKSRIGMDSVALPPGMM